tara:strand:+ start:338 stop:829 length:492 start_codon:yes stop_codon:yes gene_type:complete
MDNIKNNHFCDYQFEKIDSFDNLSIYHGYRKFNDHFTRTIFITLQNNDIIAEFSIEGKGITHQFDSGQTNSMSISVEDDYQGNGYTKIMMKHMIDKLYKDIPDMIGDYMLFIDADASEGYWDKIGMEVSRRYGYGRIPKYADREGAGYEKYITIDKLNKYVYS